MSPNTKAWLIVAAMILILGLVGRMDYVDALEKENSVLKHRLQRVAQCGRTMEARR